MCHLSRSSGCSSGDEGGALGTHGLLGDFFISPRIPYSSSSLVASVMSWSNFSIMSGRHLLEVSPHSASGDSSLYEFNEVGGIFTSRRLQFEVEERLHGRNRDTTADDGLCYRARGACAGW